tara:strand:+ start:672 stop:1655 length:984 start_codon:yes stop_codon:yes gene_type:complete
MESLKKEIMDNRKISEKSLNIYLKNLNKLAKDMTGKEWSGTKFLKDYDEVIKHLGEKTLSTRKNYLASILVGLSPSGRGKYEKGYEKVAKEYTDYLTSQAKEYESQIIEQKKSAKQQGKWTTREALEKVRKTYANAIKKLGYTQKTKEFRAGKEKRHQELIQKYLVASLYLLHPPRRNSYANMKVLTNTEFNKLTDKEKDEGNYLVIVSRNSKFFSFGDYKTKKKYGVQKITIDKSLNSVLNLWLNFNNTENLLLNSQGGKMTTNGLTKFLYKVFEPTGKKISSTMIRHIVLTDKYGDESGYKEKLDTATKMGHSVEEQQKTYVKKD